MDSGPKTVGTALEGLQFEGWKAGLIPRAWCLDLLPCPADEEAIASG